MYPIPERCDVCKSLKVQFIHVSEIGKRSDSEWPFIYYCPSCEASVGCHKGTRRPLGRMADSSIRNLRKAAHFHFDRIWQQGFLERNEAYAWLAEQLGVEREKCHFGFLRAKHLVEAISICKQYLEENTGKAKLKKEKQNEKRTKRKQRESKQYTIKRTERAKRTRKAQKRRRGRKG
jgi:hypothetical protein